MKYSSCREQNNIKCVDLKRRTPHYWKVLYDEMSLDELRQYVLTHREDNHAFDVYIDRSKATGRMIAFA